MVRLPIFVFGTLRQSQCNHLLLAGMFDRMRPAKLPGFCRVELLMIAREPDSIVDGELYDLTPETYARTLQGCDDLEEIPVGELVGHDYRRIAVRVLSDDGEAIAWAYVRPDAESDTDLLPIIEAELCRLSDMTNITP